MTSRFLVDDTNQAWAPCVVDGTYRADVSSTAWSGKSHLLDDKVEIVGDRVQLQKSCSELLQQISNVVEGTPTGGGDPLSRTGTIVLRSVTEHFANMVRKAIMTRIHVFAASEVTIMDNTSTYIDEVIAHRIGQLAYFVPMDLANDGGDIFGEIPLKVGPTEVRGKDITFPQFEDVSVVPTFENTTIIVLDDAVRFSARVRLTRKMALSTHDIFSAIETPTYLPLLRLVQEKEAVIAPLLASKGYEIRDMYGVSGVITRCNEGQTRRETVEELLRNLGISPLSDVFCEEDCIVITFNSHEQHSPRECVRLAMEQISQEIEDFRLEVAASSNLANEKCEASCAY